MPNYDYFCEGCGFQEEIFQKITDATLTLCPRCQKDSFKRGPGGGIGLSFQGSGFYITDYGPKKPATTQGSENSCCPCGKPKEKSCNPG